jgi:CarD family transcriptional regulator
MDFHVGDTVIHRSYGPGKVVKLEDRNVHGSVKVCYVVDTGNLTIYVPVEPGEKPSLRGLASHGDFKKIRQVLSSPGQPLPDDRQARQEYLHSRMHSGDLVAISEVIRDLTLVTRAKKLSDNDKAILERARNLLVDEWALCLSISPAQAEKELNRLLLG